MRTLPPARRDQPGKPSRRSSLLLSLTIQTRQISACRRADPRRLSQPRQKLFIVFAGVTADDTAQGRIRFQRRRVDPDDCPFHQAGSGQALQHPSEDRAMRLQINQPTRPRNRRVVRRRLIQPDTERVAQRQRVRRAPW